MATKKKTVSKTKKEDIILMLKDALIDEYKLPIEKTPTMDQFTRDMLFSYYEIPGRRSKVVPVIRFALVTKGIAKDLPMTDEYDGQLADIVMKWQGSTKFNNDSWQKLLS